MPTYFRGDQARIQVSCPNNPEIKLDSLSWDSMTGGDITASGVKYPPGGMAPTIALGGIPQRSDITITRIWSDTLIGAYKAMDNACGRAFVVVTYTVLLAQNNPFPNSTVTYTGVLDGVTRPDYDSTATAEAKLQIVVSANRALN